MKNFIRSTFAGLALAGLFSVSGCASLGGGTLLGTLQQTASLATQLTGWQANLPAVLSEAQLSQVDNFAGTAGSLVKSFKDLTGGNAMSAGLQNVTDLLGKVSNFKASDLMALAPDAQRQQVNKIGDLGAQLTSAVETEINALKTAGS